MEGHDVKRSKDGEGLRSDEHTCGSYGGEDEPCNRAHQSQSVPEKKISHIS